MTLRNQYVGRAGQLAVMSELSWRGYNIAIPEIDIGDDVFVVEDVTGRMWRLQVKTATEKPQKRSSKYQFKIKNSAIEQGLTPDLHFIFAMRAARGWRFLIIARNILQNYIKTQKIGTLADKYRRLDIVLRSGDSGDSAKCASADWTHHLDDWSAWPELS